MGTETEHDTPGVAALRAAVVALKEQVALLVADSRADIATKQKFEDTISENRRRLDSMAESVRRIEERLAPNASQIEANARAGALLDQRLSTIETEARATSAAVHTVRAEAWGAAKWIVSGVVGAVVALGTEYVRRKLGGP